MALQSSGQISLLDIANEFGGSGQHAISEYYRGGANVPNISVNNSIPTSGAIDFADFYGTQNTLDVQTVTVGSTQIGYNTLYGFNDGQIAGAAGSISDGTSNLYGGATIRRLGWFTSSNVSLIIAGNRANSGWTTMTVNGSNFNRSSATYTYTSGGNYTLWSWSTGTNPFGTSGTKEVTWV